MRGKVATSRRGGFNPLLPRRACATQHGAEGRIEVMTCPEALDQERKAHAHTKAQLERMTAIMDHCRDIIWKQVGQSGLDAVADFCIAYDAKAKAEEDPS